MGQGVGDELPGDRVEFDAVGAQLVVRETREISDTTMTPAMNKRGDGDAVGFLDDVLGQGVAEHGGQHAEPYGGETVPAADR